ncbi:hypothetical protein [Candidatus Magnetomonas plexicatena]|uniref:hypothetical protein n=1 Tax=Candidatus Magnetomonas plexicatena TaxID=2552947 RepID=UPI0011011108|nr:hypothetical protein E2O03_009510 [Nitrospirales bacterium LBB_01]
MDLYRKPAKTEKRRRRNPISKFVFVVSVICWLLFVVTLVYIGMAMPQRPTIFDPKGIYTTARTYWDTEMISNAFASLNITLAMSLIGLALNAIRMKRASDKINPSLLFMTVLSLTGILIIYFNFNF